MIARACYVQCDRCGNAAEVVVGDAEEARKVAHRQGFVHVGKEDRCPVCDDRELALMLMGKPFNREEA